MREWQNPELPSLLHGIGLFPLRPSSSSSLLPKLLMKLPVAVVEEEEAPVSLMGNGRRRLGGVLCTHAKKMCSLVLVLSFLPPFLCYCDESLCACIPFLFPLKARTVPWADSDFPVSHRTAAASNCGQEWEARFWDFLGRGQLRICACIRTYDVLLAF